MNRLDTARAAPRAPHPPRPLAAWRAPAPVALAACLALAGTAAAADGPAAVARASPPVPAEAVLAFVDAGDGAARGARVVKGAPYCAEAVHETVQWLPDPAGGAPNRIVQSHTTRLCRDGEGRTRQEAERGRRKIVYLDDPVAGASWVLDPERKSARRSGVHADAGIDAAAWQDYGERMRTWARDLAQRVRPGAAAGAQPPTPPAPPTPPPPPPTPVVITRADGAPHAEVNVVRLGDGAPAGADWPLPPPPAVQWRAQSLAPRGPGAVTPLGSRDIDGVRAEGERTTWVIEAGKVGNERPITITREVWTAPDLMVTLSSRDFDPRRGEVNYRLRALRRGEPDPALMRVPADWAQPTVPARPAPRGSGG